MKTLQKSPNQEFPLRCAISGSGLKKGLEGKLRSANQTLNARIDDLSANIRVLSGRIDGLTKEISSIKSDVIALMKEKLEEK